MEAPTTTTFDHSAICIIVELSLNVPVISQSQKIILCSFVVSVVAAARSALSLVIGRANIRCPVRAQGQYMHTPRRLESVLYTSRYVAARRCRRRRHTKTKVPHDLCSPARTHQSFASRENKNKYAVCGRWRLEGTVVGRVTKRNTRSDYYAAHCRHRPQCSAPSSVDNVRSTGPHSARTARDFRHRTNKHRRVIGFSDRF